MSNSDAHSPPALAREATIFATELDYFAVREALRTGDGLAGTLEFFPEEGKYHADGHRACGVNWQPAQTRAAGGLCPECGKPLTVGVLSRVEELADRPEGTRRRTRRPVTHLLRCAEILGEIDRRRRPKSKTVEGRLNALVAALGPELAILRDAPLDDIGRAGGELLGEAIRRLRRGEVQRIPGYDGEYGVIGSSTPTSCRRHAQADALFDVPCRSQRSAEPQPSARKAPAPPRRPRQARPAADPAATAAPRRTSRSSRCSPAWRRSAPGCSTASTRMQRVAASAPGGPLLIVAGPGTGKTRTLTHRIAYLCAELGVFPEHCLAITFTRRAAEELRHRLDGLLGPVAEDVTVATFHSLGLRDPARERRGGRAAAGLPDRRRRRTRGRRARRPATTDATYVKLLRGQDLVDLDELITLPLELLRGDADLVDRYQGRWRWIFVDEYQDVDEAQYELLRLLCPPDGNLCAIGDPDQAIYSFRGADVGVLPAVLRRTSPTPGWSG